MIDAYTHLDLTNADPIADMLARMDNAGLEHALAVETWKADNLSWLHQLMEHPSPRFRVVLCFRPVLSQSVPDILRNSAVVGIRARTGDLAEFRDAATALQDSGKWLVPHAENGIGALSKELLALAERSPGLKIYLPHLGWPTKDKVEDPDWKSAVADLRQIPGLVAGVSAMGHFSAMPFPHADIKPFATHLAELFGPASMVAASDYPLMDNERYAEYMRLAYDWTLSNGAAAPAFERIFSNVS